MAEHRQVPSRKGRFHGNWPSLVESAPLPLRGWNMTNREGNATTVEGTQPQGEALLDLPERKVQPIGPTSPEGPLHNRPCAILEEGKAPPLPGKIPQGLSLLQGDDAQEWGIQGFHILFSPPDPGQPSPGGGESGRRGADQREEASVGGKGDQRSTARDIPPPEPLM